MFSIIPQSVAMQNLSSLATCRLVAGAYDLARGRFPDVVRIETTNACNAKCVICPHHKMARPVRRMDNRLFAQIIDECAVGRPKEIHLHNFGEPLLDKALEGRIRYAKQRTSARVKIFSNGSLVTRERARAMIEAGLDEIKISMDGATREEFQRIRPPLKYDQVVQNIKDLVAVRNEMGAATRIRFACCSTSDKESTMQSLENLVDGFSFGKIHNWHGPEETIEVGGVRKPCSRLWRTFTVLADGNVALCCLDYDGQVILGRLDEKTRIEKIWNNDAYQRVRRLHREARQAELSLCRYCTKAFLYQSKSKLSRAA